MAKDVERILSGWKASDHSLRSAWWYRDEFETRVLFVSATFESTGVIMPMRPDNISPLTYPSVVVPVGLIDGEDIRAGRLDLLGWPIASSVCIFHRKLGVR